MKGFTALKAAALVWGLIMVGCNGELGLRFGQELCDTARPCSTGFVCDNGVCVPGSDENEGIDNGLNPFDEQVDLPDLEDGVEPPVENTCRVDAQCRDDESCIDGRCLTQPCANVACGEGEQCSFSCIPTEDSCDGVICDANLETCIGGRCVPSCTADTCDTGCDTVNDPNCGPDGECRDGTLCVQGREFGRCIPYLPCDDRFCADGFLCTLNAGGCAPASPCDPSPCNPGWSCQVRNGLPVCVESACSGKVCGPGETCRSGNCIDECESVPCEEGGRLCPDPGQACCDGICCAEGLQCRGLECLPPEGVCDPDCGPGQICVNSQCFCRENPSVPCEGGECCVPLMSGGPDVPGIAECLDVCADNPCPVNEPLCVRDCSVPEGFRCASSCDEITCDLPNTICDPTDGGCKCGAVQETCDDDECCDGSGCVDPCLGNPCSGEAVNRGCRRDCSAPGGFECIDLCADTVCAIPGTICDPNDGLCKCGLEDQFCASASFCCVDGTVDGYENDSSERCVSDPCDGDPCNGQQCVKDCAVPDGFFCVDNCADGSGGETVASCATTQRNPNCDAATPGGRCWCAPPGVEPNICAGTERCVRDVTTDSDGVEVGPDGDGSGNVLGCDDPCAPNPCGPLDCVRDGLVDKGFRCVDRCTPANLARVTDRNPDCDRMTGDPWCEVAARACTPDEVCVRDISTDADGADIGPDGDGSSNALGCSANPCAGTPCGELECAEDPTLEKGFRCINNCRPEEVGAAAPSCSDDEPNNPDCNPIDGDCSCRESFGVFGDCELDECCNTGVCDNPCAPNPCPASGDGADQTRCIVECDNDNPTGRDFSCVDPCNGINCEDPAASATAGPNNPECFPDGNDFACGCTDGDTQCRTNQCCNPDGSGCYDPCVGNPCGTDPGGRTLCVASCSFSDDGLPDFECRNPCDPNPCVDPDSPFYDPRTNPICVPQNDGSPLCTCDDEAVCDEAAGDSRDNVAFCAIDVANPLPSTSTCIQDPCDDDADDSNGLNNACIRGEGPSAETTLCTYTAPNAPRDGTNNGFICLDPCTIDVGPGGCNQPNPVQFRFNEGRNCRCLCEFETAQTDEANTSLGVCSGATAFCEGTGSSGRTCTDDPCGDIDPATGGLQTVCTSQAPNTTCIRDLDDPTGVGFDCDNPCDPNICPPAGSPGAIFCTSEADGTASCGCGGVACDGPTNFCDVRSTPTCVADPCAGNPCATNPTNTECVLDLADTEGDGDGFTCVDPCPANACNTSNDRLFGPVALRQGDQCLCVCEVATATRCDPSDSPAGRGGFARCVGSGASRTCDPDVCDSDDGTAAIDNPCPVTGVDDPDEFECRRQNNVNNVDGFTCRDPCTNGRRNQCRNNEAPANPDCFGIPDGSFDCGCGDAVCGDGTTPNAFCTNADVCILDPCDFDNNPANGIQNRCNVAPPSPGLTRCVYDDSQPEGFLCVDPCPSCSQPRPDRFVSADGNSCVCGCGDDDTDPGFNCSGNTAVCTGTGPADRVCLADPCDADPAAPGRQTGVCPGSFPATNTLCEVDDTLTAGFRCLNPCDVNDPCVDPGGDPIDPANPFCEPTADGGTLCVCTPGDDCGRNGSDIFAPDAFCANTGDPATAVCVEDPCDDPSVSGLQNRCLTEGGGTNTRCEYRDTAPGYVCVNPCVGVSCAQPEPDVVRFNDGQSCGCSCGSVAIDAPVANACTGDTCDAGTCVGDACAAFPCDTLPNTFCERDSGAPNGRNCLDPCASDPCSGNVNPNCEAQLGGTAECVCEPGEVCGGSPNAICVGGNTCVLDPCDDPGTAAVDNRCANSSATATRCVYTGTGTGFRCEDPCTVDAVSCGTQPEPTRVRFNDGASCGCACGEVDIGESVLPDCSGPFAFCDSTGPALECQTDDPCGDISSAPGLQTVCSANAFDTRCNRDLGNLSGPGFFCSAPCDTTDCSGVVNPICEPLEDGTAVCVCEPGSICTGTNPFCDVTMGLDMAMCVANVCDPNLCPAGGDPGATRCVPDDASPDGFSCVDPCDPNPCSTLANPICQRDGNFFDCVCEGDQVCGDGGTPNAVCDQATTPGTPICREDPCAGNPCLPAVGGRTQCVIDLGEPTGFACLNPCEEGGNATCAADAANPFCEPNGDTFRCVCAPGTACNSGAAPFCVQSTRTCDPNPCAGNRCGVEACELDNSQPDGFVCVNYCEEPQFPSGLSCDVLTDGRNPRCNPADSDPDLEDRCGCGASYSVCGASQLCCPILGGGGGEACAPQQCAGDFDCSFPLICDPCIGCVDPGGG